MSLGDQISKLFFINFDDPDHREHAYIRLLTVLALLLLPIIGLGTWQLQDGISTSAIGISELALLGLLLLSYQSKKTQQIAKGLYGVFFLITLSLLFNAYRHNFGFYHTLLFVALVFGLTMLFRTLRQLLTYALLTILCALAGLWLAPSPLVSPLFVASALVAYFTVVYVSLLYRIQWRQRLEANSDFMKSLFDNAFDAVIVVDYYSGNIVDCNKLAVKLFGYEDKHDLIGRDSGDFRKVSRTKEEEREFKLRLQKDGIFREEIEYISTSDDVRWGDLMVYPLEIRGAHYRIYRLVDITESKLVAEQLRQQESEYQSLINNTNEGIVKVDNDDNITFVNERYCEIVGYTKEELMGVQAHGKVITNQDEIARFTKMREERKQGIPGTYQMEHTHKDGHSIWLEIIGVPLHGLDDEIVGSIGFTTDITQQKAAQDALLASELKFRSLAENAPVLILRLDSDGHIEYINRLSEDYSTQEVIGAKVFSFIEAPFRLTMQDHLKAVFRAGLVIDFELRAMGTHRKMTWYSVRLAPVYEGDKVIYVEAILSDISKLKRITEALSISEETYREIFDTTSDQLYVISRENRILDVNRAVVAES